MRLTNIAGENQFGCFLAVLHRHLDEGRAKDMSCNLKGYANAGDNAELNAEIMQLEQLQCAIGIVYRKQRLDELATGTHALAISQLRIALLDMRAVRQQNRAQLLCRFCTMDITAEAVLNQLRQKAAMVDVRMRQHNSLNL